MNYWPRWINAIKKRTASLSLMQMGAYDRLLDHYYAEDGPLPGTVMECCRIVGAVTKPEQEAVRFVLDRFFSLENGQYRNERADEEIQLALPKIASAKANGAKGGRPKGPGKKPGGFPAGKPDGGFQEPAGQAPQPQQVGGIEPDGSTPPAAGFGTQPSGEYEPPPDAALPGLAYASIAGRIRQAGMAALDPGYPAFRALVDAGATADEFIGFVADALGKDQPFKWLVGAVSGERKRAAQLAGQLHRGAMPNKQQALEQRNRAVGEAWAARMLAEGVGDAAE